MVGGGICCWGRWLAHYGFLASCAGLRAGFCFVPEPGMWASVISSR